MSLGPPLGPFGIFDSPGDAGSPMVAKANRRLLVKAISKSQQNRSLQ